MCNHNWKKNMIVRSISSSKPNWEIVSIGPLGVCLYIVVIVQSIIKLNPTPTPVGCFKIWKRILISMYHKCRHISCANKIHFWHSFSFIGRNLFTCFDSLKNTQKIHKLLLWLQGKTSIQNIACKNTFSKDCLECSSRSILIADGFGQYLIGYFNTHITSKDIHKYLF